MTDEERIAYLAGDHAGALDPVDAAELGELHALLADPALWTVPGQGLEDTVVAAVTSGARRETGGEKPVPPPSAGSPAGGESARRPRRRPRRAVIAWAAGAAAAAVIGIGTGIGVTSGGPHATTFSAALAGTSLAPGASAQATLTQTTAGWRITLHVSGLPRLDDGRFYEAWLKNPAGILVPVGTFNQSGDITLWSGVPPTQFPVITVTRQLANGNPASSGQRVLIGQSQQAG